SLTSCTTPGSSTWPPRPSPAALIFAPPEPPTEGDPMSAQITLVGRLTADPELRFTPTGTAVARFTVATSRRRKDGDQWVDADTTFWVCTAWEQLAEHIAEHLTKGAAVIVVGQAHQTSWESEDGQKRSRIE